MLVGAGADVVIADDGLQHYALARDLEIVVLDGERRLGNGRMLPAGPLREPVRRLREGALVMVNGESAGVGGEMAFRLRVTGAVALNRRERRLLAVFSGQKVWAVAGIGNPARFHAELRRHGIDPVAVPVPDHGRVDLARLREEADWPILMTEKDAVKYAGYRDAAAWYLPVEVEMADEVESAVMARLRAILPVPAPAASGEQGG
jgi:tetraacyldisaccharide 4'-kinase